MNKIWMNVLCVCVCVLSLSICVIEMDMVGANCAELPRFSDYYYQCVDVRNGTTRWWTWTTVANVGWRRRPTTRSCSPRLFYQRRPRSIHNVSAVHRFGHDWNIWCRHTTRHHNWGTNIRRPNCIFTQFTFLILRSIRSAFKIAICHCGIRIFAESTELCLATFYSICWSVKFVSRRANFLHRTPHTTIISHRQRLVHNKFARNQYGLVLFPSLCKAKWRNECRYWDWGIHENCTNTKEEDTKKHICNIIMVLCMQKMEFQW